MSDVFVSVVSGEDILVQLGDGASPEVFTHDCMINGSRGFNRTATTTDQQIPNCTDPSKPPKTMRRTDSTDSTISGEGLLHSASVLAWLNRVGKTINCRVRRPGSFQVAG
ncbi:hypothetical protein K4A07_18585, partial [Lactiplantibacillus plantarum]|nr:hypothetical protein [Lactiplantibacillus plantarum]